MACIMQELRLVYHTAPLRFMNLGLTGRFFCALRICPWQRKERRRAPNKNFPDATAGPDCCQFVLGVGLGDSGLVPPPRPMGLWYGGSVGSVPGEGSGHRVPLGWDTPGDRIKPWALGSSCD